MNLNPLLRWVCGVEKRTCACQECAPDVDADRCIGTFYAYPGTDYARCTPCRQADHQADPPGVDP